MSTLAIITVTYNAEDNISSFLSSLEKNKDFITGIYVVDNNSQDTTLVKLSFWNSPCTLKVVKNNKNYGYGYAINLGIKNALLLGYDYICITNNDLTFEAGLFLNLIEESEKNNIDVLGVPASINGQEVGCGHTLDPITLLPNKDIHLLRSHINKLAEETPLIPVGFPHGSTILFKKRFFKEIGNYDPELFFGGDELDFLYRIYNYNKNCTEKITTMSSLRSFSKVDNLSKHNTKHKITKAINMLQGVARIYMKHRYTPTSFGLYQEQYKLIKTLSKGKWIRCILLFLFSIRGIIIEATRYYKKKMLPNLI